MKIVTRGKTDLDNFLAVAVAVVRFPQATVVRLDKLDALPEAPDSIYIDVGGKYQPPRFFDDPDKNLTSLELILQHFYPKLYEIAKNVPELRFIRELVLLGPGLARYRYFRALRAAGRRDLWWGINEILSVIPEMFPEAYSRHDIISPDNWIHCGLRIVGRNFIDKLYELAK